MTPEQVLVASAINAWNVNVERADKLFSGLSEQQLITEVAPGKNRLIYLWGHLTAVHDAMHPLLGIGQRLHPDLEATFIKEPDKAVAQLPSAAELKQQWAAVNGSLQAGFSNWTASDWTQKHTAVSDEDFATNPVRNRLSILLSRTSHIAYHLGQGALAPK